MLDFGNAVAIDGAEVNLGINIDGAEVGVFYRMGGGGDKFFEFAQNVPAQEWRITHNLQKYPSVTVVDSGGSIVVGDIQYIDASNIVLSFQSAFAGKAYLN